MAGFISEHTTGEIAPAEAAGTRSGAAYETAEHRIGEAERAVQADPQAPETLD